MIPQGLKLAAIGAVAALNLTAGYSAPAAAMPVAPIAQAVGTPADVQDVRYYRHRHRGYDPGLAIFSGALGVLALGAAGAYADDYYDDPYAYGPSYGSPYYGGGYYGGYGGRAYRHRGYYGGGYGYRGGYAHGGYGRGGFARGGYAQRGVPWEAGRRFNGAR
jgi:hypothetical protein